MSIPTKLLMPLADLFTKELRAAAKTNHKSSMCKRFPNSRKLKYTACTSRPSVPLVKGSVGETSSQYMMLPHGRCAVHGWRSNAVLNTLLRAAQLRNVRQSIAGPFSTVTSTGSPPIVNATVRRTGP